MLLLVFHGKSASPMEKVKASGMAQAIDDERGGKPERETFHDGQSDAELQVWWENLGDKPGPGQSIKTAEEGGNDDDIKVDYSLILGYQSNSAIFALLQNITDIQHRIRVMMVYGSKHIPCKLYG